MGIITEDKIVIGADYHFVWYPLLGKEGNIEMVDKSHLIMRPDAEINSIIEKQNRLTGDDGVFIFLGDLLHKSFITEDDIPPEMKDEIIMRVESFTGKYKILVRGNHDLLPDEFYLKHGFTHVCSSIVYNNVIFAHQHFMTPDYMINIHGHIHGAMRYNEKVPKRYLDMYTIEHRTTTLADARVEQVEYMKKVLQQEKDPTYSKPVHYIPGVRLYLEDILNG